MHEFILDLHSRYDKEDGGFCCQAEKEEKVKVGDGKRPLASEAGVVRKRLSSDLVTERKAMCASSAPLSSASALPALPDGRPTPSPDKRQGSTVLDQGKGGGAERISPVLQNKRKENTQKLENSKIGVKSEKISVNREGFRLRN